MTQPKNGNKASTRLFTDHLGNTQWITTTTTGPSSVWDDDDDDETGARLKWRWSTNRCRIVVVSVFGVVVVVVGSVQMLINHNSRDSLRQPGKTELRSCLAVTWSLFVACE